MYLFVCTTSHLLQIFACSQCGKLFHDLRLRSYLYHCVRSAITTHNLTPEKRGPTL